MPPGRECLPKGIALSRESVRRRSRLRREWGLAEGCKSLESLPAGSRPACLQVILTCLKMSLPDRGRRVLLGAGRPTEHPLPSPAGNPAGSRIHSSSHCFGFASAVSSESRPLSFGMKAGTQSDLQGWACPRKSFGKFPATAMLPDA